MRNIIACVMMATVLMTSGMTCQKSGPKQVAYTSLAAVGSAVSNAGDAVAQARLQGKVSDNDWDQIKEAHRKYLAAYNTACTLAAYDFTKYAPSELVKLQIEFLNMVNIVLESK